MQQLQSIATPPPSIPSEHDWKKVLRDAVRDPDVLVDLLQLPESFREPARRAAMTFPVVVPRGFLARMRPADPEDPLLLQVLPLGRETDVVEGFVPDPLGEARARRAAGLLEKYAGRVLLIAAPGCAVHCRYCFRRHHPYRDAPRGRNAWQPALDVIASDRTVHEAILSGGDPLMLSDEALLGLVSALEGIRHVRRLRIHTRLPIVIPERLHPGLVQRLVAGRLAPVVVVHSNHPREIDAPTGEALQRVVRGGIPVLSQSVLLRGVNDDEAVLAELSERLIDRGVTPYYLHQLDPVAGAAHFHVSEERGREIIARLRKRLPGYAVPRYVREVPGAAHKMEL